MPAHIGIVKHQCDKATVYAGPGWSSSDSRSKQYTANYLQDVSGNWTPAFDETCTDSIAGDGYWSKWEYHWSPGSQSVHYTDNYGGDNTSSDLSRRV